LKLPKDNLNP